MLYCWAPIAALIVLGGAAGVKTSRSSKGGFTSRRKEIFDAAYKCNDTYKMRTVADAFDKVNLPLQAKLLRQRASLRDQPKEVKDKRKAIFRKAMSSKNKIAVLKVAEAFESIGAIGAAAELRKYASGLKSEIKTDSHDD